jgi:hypothetical protein
LAEKYPANLANPAAVAMTGPHLVSTTAKPATCPRCHSPLLVALAEGVTVRIDATPLADRAAEITALLDNRATYSRFGNGELVHRDGQRITDPFLNRLPIHAAHQCTGPAQGELF